MSDDLASRSDTSRSDAARSSLFGGAASRNVAKPNPYAPNTGSSTSSNASLGFEAPPMSGAASTSTLPEDAARTSLIGGAAGRARAAAAAVAAATANVGAPLSSAPTEPSAALGGMMDEGDMSFDFEGLNMMAAVGGGGGGGDGGAGGLGDDGLLDFTAIDADLARFSQDTVIRDALNRGVDLRSYSRQVDAELRAMEALSIGDYVRESDAIAGLFSQVLSCEQVLTTMQGLLQGFQVNLGGISDEIRSLQEESLALSVKMQNRRNVGGKVKGFLAKVAVSEGLIARICDAPIDETWLRDLRAVSEKVEFCSGALRDREARSALATHAPGLAQPALPVEEGNVGLDALAELSVRPLDTPAGRDAVPQIEKLRVKAVSRVREFLLRGIADVVKPRGNMQRQQEHALLRYAYAMAFLSEHGAEAAREVRGTYADGVSRAFGDIFRTYAADLAKAVLPGPAKTDAMGNFEPVPIGTGGGPAKAPPLDPFALSDGGRSALLLDGGADAAPLTVHVIAAEKTRLPWESVFRSVEKHLIDVASAEEGFCRKFFGEAKEGREVLSIALSKSTAAALEAAETHVATSWDAPGLLLTLALAAAHKKGHVGKGFKGLTSYFDRIALLVWPRWKLVFEAQLASVKTLGASLVAGKQPSSFPPGDPKAPHALTCRFASLNASALMLHRQALAGAGAPLEDETLPSQL